MARNLARGLIQDRKIESKRKVDLNHIHIGIQKEEINPDMILIIKVTLHQEDNSKKNQMKKRKEELNLKILKDNKKNQKNNFYKHVNFIEFCQKYSRYKLDF